jgi:hypothetical protein
MVLKSFIFLFLITGCSGQIIHQKQSHVPILKITEIGPNKWTSLTKQNLEHLLKIYDLTPILFTKDITIQSMVVPRSHPVLTLNTRYAESPQELLALFIHEQFHWWVAQQGTELEKAISELKDIYPSIPVKGAARSEYSSYLHLIVCLLEFETLVFYLGEDDANKLITKYINLENLYPWIYGEVRDKRIELNQILNRNKLKPGFLQNPTKKPSFS